MNYNFKQSLQLLYLYHTDERKTTHRTGKGNADNIATAMSNPILPVMSNNYYAFNITIIIQVHVIVKQYQP